MDKNNITVLQNSINLAPRKKRVTRPGSYRRYHAAANSRLTEGFNYSNASADSELKSSLTQLRGRSRALVRDAGFAKRAKVVIQNNVIGTGIGLQADVKSIRDKPIKRDNKEIETAWGMWTRAENCHTGGQLNFQDLERLAMGQVFEAGEIFIRKHFFPFGPQGIPLALEIIEPERLADEILVPGPLANGATVRMGVEIDKFQRPLAYWLTRLHSAENQFYDSQNALERVPANQIIHLRIIDRWPQTRGEPWMHAVIRKLNDLDGYTEAEITAARGSASYFGTIKLAPEAQYGEDVESEAHGSEVAIEPGIIERLGPGEELDMHSPNRPNSGAESFLRFMLREMAAGIGTSYESLSRDYSQSNYSSSRLALLDDRDLWRMLQLWFIRSLREPLHRTWMQQAVLSRVVNIPIESYMANPEKYNKARYKPRGWGWIDPTKEVAAYKEAVKAGFTTVSDVISQTGNGRDLEDVLEERRNELDSMAQMDLQFDTDINNEQPAAPAVPPPDDPPGGGGDDEDDEDQPPDSRVLNFGDARQ